MKGVNNANTNITDTNITTNITNNNITNNNITSNITSITMNNLQRRLATPLRQLREDLADLQLGEKSSLPPPPT